LKRACILTLGCKVNWYESQQIVRQYADQGYEIHQRFIPNADVYIVNTCMVTAHAEKKSRNTVTRCRGGLGGERPVIVCGCCSPDRTLNKLDCHAVQSRKRAFIKVQDGCNNFCSYCIIPYLRGRSTSRPIVDVIAEVHAGNKPVVITGIDLSSYGLDIGTDLMTLCIEVDKCGVPFELSSIEVGIVTDAFLLALRACKNFVQKFHLPLQSGSDTVLKSMNRKYKSADYLRAVELIRQYFPNAVLSTDVIVGFVGETPADLAQTYAVIDAVKFAKVHTFPYSDRHLDRFRK